jgi:RNA exonuclease 4
MVAEVAIVDWNGATVYHTYVQPTGPVLDYRTDKSGITPEKLVGAPPFAEVQRNVIRVLNGNTVIGHALENDLRALKIVATNKRNTAHHAAFQRMGPTGQLQPRRLAELYEQYVGNRAIQQGSHSALEDARASMRVYRTYHAQWEKPVAHEGPRWNTAAAGPFSRRHTSSPAPPPTPM